MVIDSIPPATANVVSPSLTFAAAEAMALIPDRHTLLMVVHGTVIGSPPPTAAWRDVIWP